MATIAASGKAASTPAEEVKMARAVELNNQVNSHRHSLHEAIAERNELILQLRAENPRYWTYGNLATQLDCSPELISTVVRGARAAALDDTE